MKALLIGIAGVIVWVATPSLMMTGATGCSSHTAGMVVPEGGPNDSGSSGDESPWNDYPPTADGGPDCGPPVSTDGGTVTLAGQLNVIRYAPAVAPLPGGKILVTGGWNTTDGTLKTAEIFDPSIGTSTPTGSMASEHLWGGWGAPLPTLLDGRILVAGGVDSTGALQDSAELYDPEAGTFSPTGPLAQAVVSMFPDVLADGSVLYVGGSAVSIETNPSGCPDVFGCWSGDGVSEVQRYSPSTGTFMATGSLAETRPWGCNVVLPSGAVLALGGQGGDGGSERNIEQYAPATGVWQTVATLPTPYCDQAFLLPTGMVLMVGTAVAGSVTTNAQLLDPITYTASPTTGETPVWAGLDVQLANGDVLAIGGSSDPQCPTSYAARYSVADNSWSRVAGPSSVPQNATILLLSSGDVALIGGGAVTILVP
jgi:hypothetical protein